MDLLKTPRRRWTREMVSQYDLLKNFLKRITKNPTSEKKVLIVAHGNTNRLILSILLELGLKNLVRFGQLETAINKVYWLDSFKNWRLTLWNDIHHLPKRLLSKERY